MFLPSALYRLLISDYDNCDNFFNSLLSVVCICDNYSLRSITDSMYYCVQNVRFLANFITEAGIIIKRSKVMSSASSST